MSDIFSSGGATRKQPGASAFCEPPERIWVTPFMERCKRGAAQPRVEEHAQRALEPWEAGLEKVLALQGRHRLLFRPCRALREPHSDPGFRPLRGSAFGGLHPGLYCSALAALLLTCEIGGSQSRSSLVVGSLAGGLDAERAMGNFIASPRD
jgi:hypothetical protein